MAKNDFVRLNLDITTTNLSMEKLGWEWPPPKFIHMGGHGDVGFKPMTDKQVEALPPSEMPYVLIRLSMSEISDEDTESMDGVARGAEYFYMKKESTD